MSETNVGNMGEALAVGRRKLQEALGRLTAFREGDFMDARDMFDHALAGTENSVAKEGFAHINAAVPEMQEAETGLRVAIDGIRDYLIEIDWTGVIDR